MQKPIYAILVCLVIVSLYAYLNSPMFITEQLEWTGLNYLYEYELRALVDFQPQNVFRIDSGEIKEALSQHPWILEIDTCWKWPNRFIVEVTERTPIALVPFGSNWFLLESEGTLLPPPVAGSNFFNLPIVTNIDLDSVDELKATARLFKAIPSSLNETFSEWNCEKRMFITRQGTQVLFGELSDIDYKFSVLETIMDRLVWEKRSANRIDLRVPSNPVTQ